METPFPGIGTAINVLAVLIGSSAGIAFGHRLRESTRSLVTDCLGLVTLAVAILSVLSVSSPAIVDLVGDGVPVLIVLGALVLGGLLGSLIGIERRMNSAAGAIQRWAARRFPAASGADPAVTSGTESGSSGAGGPHPALARRRFIEGWLTASLLFCVGPLTVLGSLNDGLGQGIDQLALKSVLDFFAATAFAASFGIGVMFSAGSVLVVQGGLTLLGVFLGSFVTQAYIDGLTAVGGLLLIGIALRLLKIKDIPVGDMLPALALMPLLMWLVSLLG